MSLPICLMIDDPAPLLNVYWWHAAQSQATDAPVGRSGDPIPREAPLDFLREFADVLDAWDIRGKFTVLPYPAGLGRITEGWPGCDPRALREWIEIVRRDVAPRMDITPEILTHAAAVDLPTMTLLAEDERRWSTHQSEATLAPYIACALRILKDAGLEANGVTSPWDFGKQVEPDYQRAIRRSLAEVSNLRRAWYFLHTDSKSTEFLSRVVWRGSDGWLVSLVSQCGDQMWSTMDVPDTGDDFVRSVADKYLTEDGRAGRLADLFHAGTPIVFHSHWQSLFSNGRRTGLRVLAEAGRRVRAAWGTDVRWTRCSALAAEVAAGLSARPAAPPAAP